MGIYRHQHRNRRFRSKFYQSPEASSVDGIPLGYQQEGILDDSSSPASLSQETL